MSSVGDSEGREVVGGAGGAARGSSPWNPPSGAVYVTPPPATNADVPAGSAASLRKWSMPAPSASEIATASAILPSRVERAGAAGAGIATGCHLSRNAGAGAGGAAPAEPPGVIAGPTGGGIDHRPNGEVRARGNSGPGPPEAGARAPPPPCA